MNGVEFKAWVTQYSQAESADPLVMGILNFTPDSFSDAAKYFDLNAAKSRIQDMIDQGVDLVDIGAESSRPGAHPVSAKEEIQRLLPLIEKIRSISDICISVDTHKPQVMSAVLGAGADWINDIFALRQPDALDLVVNYNIPVCIMHSHGSMASFGHEIDDSLDMNNAVMEFFQQRLATMVNAGIKLENIVIDPGIGFGKNTVQNLALIKHLHQLQTFNRPILLGLSRKRFIGDVLLKDVMARQFGSLTANLLGWTQGARIFRTHDVDETKQMIKMTQAIMRADNQ